MITAALAGVACAAALAAPQAGAREATPAQRALGAGLERLVASPDGPPGAIAVVQVGSRVTVHGAGVARLGSRPPRAHDTMRVASVSKAFTGATALALVRAGTLSMDDTVGARLPALPAAWHEVTLAQLMRHTSGIPDFIAVDTAQRAILASPGRAPAPRELLRFVEDQPLRFAPGSRYHYSNSDNIIVGLMVEAASGSAFASQLARHVASPLGLRRTSLPRGVLLPAPALRGYAPDPPSRPADVTAVLAGGWAWAAGGVVSTPADVNRFIRAYAAGALAGPAERDAQRRTVAGASEPPGPGVNRAGLSLFSYRTRCGTVWGHTGNTLGYTQFAAASADGRRSAVVSVSAQISPRTNPALFRQLRAAYGHAVCAAMGR